MAVGLVMCDGCEGGGYVANNHYRTPWPSPNVEPREPDGSRISEDAKRVKCNKCGGTGRMPAHKKKTRPDQRDID